MARIYAMASQVIVWLGTESRSSELAFSTMLNADHDRDASKTNVLESDQILAIFDLLSRPWFERIWGCSPILSPGRSSITDSTYL